MIVECPKCKSTFSLNSEEALLKFSKFKCSVCNHIWANKDRKKIKINSIDSNNANHSYKSLLGLNLIIIIFSIISIFVFKDKLYYIDEYWRELYTFFIDLIPI